MKTKLYYSLFTLSVLLLIVSCKKDDKLFLTQFKPKSSSYSQYYLTDSLAFEKIKQIFQDKESFLKEYMKTIAIASMDLVKDTNYLNLIDSITNSYDTIVGVDYYAYIYDQVEMAYASKFGRSLLDDFKTSLINNSATLYQRQLLDSFGLNFEIDGINFSPKYFLYYKNSGLYTSITNRLPSLTATLQFPDDSIPLWRYDTTYHTFLYTLTNLSYVDGSALIDVSLRISYQQSSNSGPILYLFGNRYEALGRCKSDMTGWCTVACKWWLGCCRCNHPFPRPRITESDYNPADEIFF